MAYSRTDVSAMQQEIAPGIYGKLDLNFMPERFRTKIETEFDGMNRKLSRARLSKYLENEKEVELYRQLTLMGDPIADAFAVKTQEIGFRTARELLERVLDEGVDNVPEAPEELKALIRDMEKKPEWLDFEKIEKYHAKTRLFNAVSQEALMRFAFMMTYMNGYQGLPMIMTGTLSGESAAKRMKETTSTFKMATLPGALKRDGVAFRSAAMVRVMHAMVRMNLLKNKEKWDFEVYGVPIPQVDQMGAALGYNFFTSLSAVRKNKPLTQHQKNGIDASRYLAYLLGMHDYFLSDDPEQVVKSWSMLGATLRDKFDPRAKDLNTATLYAYTRTGHSLWDKFMHAIDIKTTRFVYTKLVGKKKAVQMGVEVKPTDILGVIAMTTILGSKFATLKAITYLPAGKQWVDEWAINETKRQLDMLGKAEYKTDEAQYSMGKAA